MAEVFAPINYVVPGYIAEGCTLLAGRPKLGKSWLCLEIALAVSVDGESALGGIECQKGSVLYLALEDNRRRLQRRIRKVMLMSEDAPERLHLATEWPRANEGGIDQIRSWVRDTPDARMVIVDVLAMFKPMLKGSESFYEADYHAIKSLQAIASETGIAIIVVHHTRKGGADGDPFEKVSGTLGLSGAADSVMILDRDSQGATIYGRGRDIEEIESAAVFDKLTCRWSVQGAADDVRRTDERTEILAILKDADEALSPGDIADALGRQRNNIKQLLFKMSKSGEVVKLSGRGKYVHPERLDLAPSRTPDNHDNRDNQEAPDG
jgi:RecA-family ATPase